MKEFEILEQINDCTDEIYGLVPNHDLTSRRWDVCSLLVNDGDYDEWVLAYGATPMEALLNAKQRLVDAKKLVVRAEGGVGDVN